MSADGTVGASLLDCGFVKIAETRDETSTNALLAAGFALLFVIPDLHQTRYVLGFRASALLAQRPNLVRGATNAAGVNVADITVAQTVDELRVRSLPDPSYPITTLDLRDLRGARRPGAAVDSPSEKA